MPQIIFLKEFTVIEELALRSAQEGIKSLFWTGEKGAWRMGEEIKARGGFAHLSPPSVSVWDPIMEATYSWLSQAQFWEIKPVESLIGG